MQNLKLAFHHFDTQQSGYITEEGVKEVMHRTGRKMSNEDIHSMIDAADIKKTGRISFTDFTNLML